MNEDLTQDLNKTAIGTIDNAGDRTQMVMEPQSNATQYAANVDCPVCHTPNPPSEIYCIDCGFALAGTPVDVAEMPEQMSLGKLVTSDGTREFPLNPGENSVGRENADVLLANNTVSRRHAKIVLENGNAFVEDANSTNGTYVDGKRLEPGQRTEMKGGCEVVFGSFGLKYEAPAAQAETASEPQAEQAAEVAGEQVVEAASEETAEMPAVEPQVADEAPAQPEPAKTPAAKLISADGALSFDLCDGVTTLGRRQGANDIVVPDPYCSGRHADIKVEGGKVIITDVGSTNGSTVNDARLTPNVGCEVHPDDQITMGQTAFYIEIIAPQAAEPAMEFILDPSVEPAQPQEPGVEGA